MKSTIKRQTTNPIVEAFLQDLCLLDGHVSVALLARHQIVMLNETRSVFIHQNLTPKLHRFSGFAAFVKLRVWFEHAEQLNHLRRFQS